MNLSTFLYKSFLLLSLFSLLFAMRYQEQTDSKLNAVSCQEGSYFSLFDNKCMKCINYCKSCKNSYECEVCEEFADKINGKCVIKTTLKCSEGCEVCDTSSNCLVCKEGYLLDNSQKCISLCNKNQIYNFDNHMCIDHCSQYQYYDQSSGLCKSCPYGCKFCTSDNPGKCIQCDTYFECKITPLDSLCTCNYICQEGYYYNTLSTNPQKCEKCGDNCRQCETVNQKEGQPLQCHVCIDGYTLNEQKLCVSKCKDGQFFEINKCEDCSVSCKTCIESSTQCTECSYGYIFANPKKESQTCYFICPSNYQYYDNNECISCSTKIANCLKCQATLTSTNSVNVQCEFCQMGYKLSGNTCIRECENLMQYYDDNTCKNCTAKFCIESKASENYCQTCSKGYLQKSNTCIQNPCKDGNLFDPVKQECIDTCLQNCYKCTSKETCDICIQDYYWKDSKCLPISKVCTKGTYFNNQHGECKACDSQLTNCQNCYYNNLQDKVMCTECNSTYYTTEEGSCKQCSSLCESCYYDEIYKKELCTKCLNNAKLDQIQGICTNNLNE